MPLYHVTPEIRTYDCNRSWTDARIKRVLTIGASQITLLQTILNLQYNNFYAEHSFPNSTETPKKLWEKLERP